MSTEATPVVAADELVELATDRLFAELEKRDMLYTNPYRAAIAESFRAALSAALPHIERGVIEWCTKVAEDHADQCDDTAIGRRTNETATSIAAAIRALSTEHDHEG